MPGPIVEVGDDLVLRTVEREDAAFVQRLFADPFARLGFHESTAKTESEVEELIEEQVEDGDNVGYMVCRDDDSADYDHPDDDETTRVAFVYGHHVDRDRPSLAFWIPPERREDGVGAAALELVLDSLFRTYDAHSVGATVVGGDDYAASVVEGAGFVEEGYGREVQFVEGEYRDVTEYGLLREEWSED
ncbi:GNAT family N-acetyltransferase [Halobacterium litoreum]|uniref:GNAT family N-acetyltransferase n=1 Tax=Halobacterium litoreum TaxID=2039234 RepID=A0ABD5NH63_9EURY|nr:GNAT family protein [Halobacterium litoreum]UHH12558.1 GNAT family N-acetyltransferase [Halobacterium litoreum]